MPFTTFYSGKFFLRISWETGRNPGRYGDLRVVGWKDHETVEKSDRSGGTEVLFLEINGGQWNESNENVTGNYAWND